MTTLRRSKFIGANVSGYDNRTSEKTPYRERKTCYRIAHVQKSAWSATLEVDGVEHRLNWSADARGMYWVMPLVAVLSAFMAVSALVEISRKSNPIVRNH